MSIVMITGGSRGLGASAALQCAKSGMGVILTYHRNPDAAETVIDAIRQNGGTAVALKLDVGDSTTFAGFHDDVAGVLAMNWGVDRFDALVNNAGHGLYRPIVEVGEDEFDALYRVHLKGPFFLTQALLPLLADGGQILNVASATARVATASVAPYAAFKGGLEVLTRYMATEFGARGIRANAIAPGPIRTELGGGISEEFETLLAGQTALGRVGAPDDIGTLVASLLLESHRWVNAQTIEVSGGYRI